jgi:hypothetical protein
MKLHLALLLLTVVCVAQQNPDQQNPALTNPSLTNEHLPLPKPSATVDIVDDALAGSPIKFFGTADAYVKPISGDGVMVWIEENNLHIQNISDKEIVKGEAEAYSTDTKGNRYHFWMGLGAFKPGDTKTLLGVKVPGSQHHLSFKHRNVYASSDYDLKPDKTPSATAHAVIVKFADGSTWVDESKVGNVPKKASDEIQK